MFKDLLLQFFLSMLPIILFLLLQDKAQSWKRFKVFISLTCGISVILCFLTAASNQQFNVDFRIVPIVLGSLYGGYIALIVLNALSVIMHFPTIDSTFGFISLTFYHVLIIVTIFFVMKSFQSANATRKLRIGITIMLVAILYLMTIIGVYTTYYESSMTTRNMIELFIVSVGFLISTWLSIYIIEGVKENRLLAFKVKQLTDNYRNEVEKLQQFIDKAPIGVLMTDRDGLITHVNNESLKMLKLSTAFKSKEQLNDQSFIDAFQPGTNEICLKLLHQALMGKSTTSMTSQEDEKMLIYTAVTLRDVTDNFISGAALITKDVTELTILRDEIGRMERLSLVGQMAASITHEIRNPMAVIRGFVQLIQERSTEGQYEYFRIIMEELDRTNLIISDFLSLAQNRELSMVQASLHTSIKDLIPLLLADANLRGQNIEVSLCDDMPDMMLNDREIKQMLLNLSRNGLEAMDEKGVLRISTECRGDQIHLTITDTGVGIPEEKMGNLFEPFFTTKSRGTGLGLPLCLSIVERHRGRIEVNSEIGQGTSFIVIFDIAELDVGYTIA